eukprot:gene5601-6969_t
MINSNYDQQQQHSTVSQEQLGNAFGYLQLVKKEFSQQPEIYSQFLDIMKVFKEQSTIGIPDVIERVKDLFKDHKYLIQGFNNFLPLEYRIDANGLGEIKTTQQHETIYLRYDPTFNSEIPFGVIPSNITHLRFSKNFNQVLQPNVIPLGVKSIKFGRDFNQRIDVGVIPPSVTQISFGEKFNQSLQKDVIPSSVLKIKFGRCYNQRIVRDETFPSSVTKLQFRSPYQTDIDIQNIPSSVESVIFELKSTESAVEVLRHLIPKSVKECKVENEWITSPIEMVIPFDRPIKVGDIPSTVERLTFSSSGNSVPIPVGAIPSSVTYLKFDHRFAGLKHGVIPTSVKELVIFCDSTLQPGMIPSSVTHLTIHQYNAGLVTPDLLPPNLVYLRYGMYYSKSITSDMIPSTVTHLCVDRPSLIKVGAIPPTVTRFSIEYSHEIHMFDPKRLRDLLPETVLQLDFNKSFSLQNGMNTFVPHLLKFLESGGHTVTFYNQYTFQRFEDNSSIIYQFKYKDHNFIGKIVKTSNFGYAPNISIIGQVVLNYKNRILFKFPTVQ